VAGLTDSSIATDRGDFSFRVLVAADGSQSVVRRHLGLPSKFGIGLYYEAPSAPTKSCSSSGPGSSARVTSGLPPPRLHKRGNRVQPRHLDGGTGESHSPAVHEGKRVRGKRRPPEGGTISHLYRGHRFGNIFLAGEAAGLASKASGEGIPFALVSGREIGRVILDPAYPMPEFRRMLVLKRRQEGYWRFFESMPRLQKVLLTSYFTMMKRPWMQEYMGY